MATTKITTPEEREEMLREIFKNYECGFIDGIEVISQALEIPWTKFEKELVKRSFNQNIDLKIVGVKGFLGINDF